MPQHEMTKSDSERIQSSQAKSGGDLSSGGFASRAQSAGDRWASSQSWTTPSGHAGSGSGPASGSHSTAPGGGAGKERR